jgi:hypothetical protein
MSQVAQLASSALFAEICPTHAALAKAMQWREMHDGLVSGFEAVARRCAPPVGDVLASPAQWSSENWKWLREFFPAIVS